MTWLSDAVVDHLGQVLETPDLTGTRYELLGPLGRGGTATVYAARDTVLRREVALKIYDQPAARGLNGGAAEPLVMGGLEHPGIVPVHDAGTLPDGCPFYAMKLVRGRRLDEVLRDEPPLGDRLRLFEKLCEPVAFAHARGVIHRDLKPQNVMVGLFGEVLVMDWGAARLAADTGLTVAGTPGFMAPEQAAGAGDERSDIFGLGALLYFLLTGRPPGAVPVTPPRAAAFRVPRPLQAICLKALASEPGSRYPDVNGLLDDLHRYQDGRRVLAHVENPITTAARLVSKYRAVVALVLAYVLVRVALLVWQSY